MSATAAPAGAGVGTTTTTQSTADHIEQVVRDASIDELLQSLGGDGFAWSRCPRCPKPDRREPRWPGDPWARDRMGTAWTAFAVDDVVWKCTACRTTSTLWALRTVVLNDPKAIARLLSRLEVDAA